MKRNYMLFIILTFSVAVTLLLYTNYKLRIKISQNLDNAQLHSLRVENILLKEGFFHSYDYSTISIDMERKLFNHKSDSLNLREITKDKLTLALFINIGACSSCYMESIHRVITLINEAKLDVMIGIGGLNQREFNAFVLTNKVEEYAYFIPENFFSGFKINPVVYFVIEKNFRTNCFYAPSDVFPELTNDYFLKLTDLYGL
ncbi:hypothetical protein [Perlabentimonas gracilis]|uniref:hypothetical protein n=1 Tax=Perlabentimonas gracilis TaxID=2715279 RepID=UPI0014076838|nr:hypothetical protein [Perlabentimonas gracilis]NHB69967.1 hypothetical protein [Perlabentimonas gracilis]